jgi:hypothetical protein
MPRARDAMIPARLVDKHARRRPEPEHRQSHQPVWRRSVMTGDWERKFMRPLDWDRHDDIVHSAERYDRDPRNRATGDRGGPIGSIGLELLRALARMARKFGGKVWPSLEHLAKEIGRSKSTVVEYLKRLSHLKIVSWARRLEAADGEWARGPQVRQITNLYRVALPKILHRYVRKPKPPQDEQARRAAMLAQIDAYQREEAADGFDAAIARGRARAEAANSVVRARKERESTERNETAPESEIEGVRQRRTGRLRTP